MLLALVGCGGEVADRADSPEHPRLAPVVFRPLPQGWHRAGSHVSWERGCPVQSEEIVTSWGVDRGNPIGPAGDMPPGGIMVSALLLRAHPDADTRSDYPRIRRLPLRLPLTTTSILEGYEHVPEYRVFASGRRFVLEVRAAINRRRPGRGMLTRAQRVVDQLRLPSWITRRGLDFKCT
jgi:hypothetical protein